ncbi:hypothetical protein QAD02_004629 [Eretmocerus hayati]|uniref:Uncharacterized protein n=1 Tax=Eretmocerus hayati TaxID=131215 RepID=A0ACC2NQJ0_9HYME|nr:hypothetical protein QAD02_004629 [Eretmocerus hayati]
MATSKFRDDSPYLKPKPTPTSEDYLYSKYVSDCECKAGKIEPVIGVAIFGLGRAGTIHMSNVISSARCKLRYVVDDNVSKHADIKKYWRLEEIPILTSKECDQIFKDPKVDAVVVCTPTHTHEGFVTKALACKKAVFCEKPIAEDPESTAKCYEAATKNGKPLFCAFNRRFDPSYENVRIRVRKGEVGHVHNIRITARDSPLPTIEYLKASGGIFHDCMVHDIDMMTWVLGEWPIKVSVMASANIPEIAAIKDYDTVAAVFHFTSGTVGMIDLSRNSSYGYDQRLEVFGPRGMVDAENEQPLHCVKTQYGQTGQRKPPIWYSFASRFRNGYAREFDHFLDVVHGKCAPAVHPKEILTVSKIASACEESARTGRTVDIKWQPSELPPVD